MRHALAYDLGGTKLAAAVVSEAGEILQQMKVATPLSNGPQGLIKSLVDVGQELLKGHSISAIGLSSAGPLDSHKGVLLNPTNFVTAGEKWGQVDIVAPLQAALKLPVLLENDAAAAVVGEFWMGGFSSARSLTVMTLGTGVGIGTMIDGRLVRCRDGFHPDFSHTYINSGDTLAPCGCGNLGCIEAYLGGLNFPQYYARKTGGPRYTGHEIVEKAKAQDEYSLKAFDLYADFMAKAIQNIVVTYGVEHIVFSGSFSNSYSLFSAKTLTLLEALLKERREGVDFMPTLHLSRIQDSAGLMGAAQMAFALPKRF
jgi:glucokinase